MVLKKAYAQDGKIIVTWRAVGSDWNAALNFVKGLPGRTFRPKTRDWEVPDNPDNRAALESAGWEFPHMASAPVPAPVVPSGPPAYLSVKLSPEALNGVSPGLTLRPYQAEAVQFLIHRDGRGLVGDEMGCIAGDALITINRHGASRKVCLRWFYESFNRPKKKEGPTFCRALLPNGRFGADEVKAVLFQGIKPVFEIETDGGKILRLTGDHELLLPSGEWKPLSSLSVGDSILTNGEAHCPACGSSRNIIKYRYAKFKGFCRTCMYKDLRDQWDFDEKRIEGTDGYFYLIGKKYHRHPRKSTSGVLEHIVIMESLLGRSLLPGEEVHHVDGDRKNNAPENLKVLSRSEHKKAHDVISHIGDFAHWSGSSVVVTPKVQKIIRITPAGETDVYDISMKGPGHNFVANGIVVHNCGKTTSSLMYFRPHPERRPVLVVCKATAKGVWADHIRDWLGERFHVIRGQSLYELPDADWYIINYDILSWRDRDQLREEKAKKAAAKEAGEPFKTRAEMVGWYKALMNIPLQGVIGDEIQMISNPDALMSKAFAKLAKHSPVFIPLSGTPIRNRPADFFTVLNLLAPEEFPNRWKYLHRYCGPKHNGFGWEFKGSSNEDELHERIKPLMIRRLKEDVMKDLPPKQRIIIPMELSPIEVEAYNELDEEFMEWIRGHAASPLEAEKFLSRLKQKIYLMKRDSVLQWIRDYIESGQKLVVFAYHRKVLEDLHAQFDREGVLLYGGTSEIDRQTCIKRFQNDDDIRLFFGQTNSAGDSITLTAAAATAFVEYPDTATQVNQCEDRVHRYGQKADSVFAYHLVAPGTTDADIMGMLQEKFEAGNQILDGRSRGNLFGDDFENFNAGLLAKYRRRAFEK